MTTDDVRDFVEQDKALCSIALEHGRDVLLRAIETLRDMTMANCVKQAQMADALKRTAERIQVFAAHPEGADDDRR